MTGAGGRVAVVTGAARGIGQAIALRLARSGHALALGDLHPADETVTAIRDMKEAGDAFAVECRALGDKLSGAGVRYRVTDESAVVVHVTDADISGR